jgi:hypothetical protein
MTSEKVRGFGRRMNPTARMLPIHVCLPAAQLDWVANAAGDRGISAGELIREAVSSFRSQCEGANLG